MTENDISYKIGNEYLHSIHNKNNEYAISLHIYTPPKHMITYY